MKLWFGGSEIPAWRTLLANEGIRDVSLSFVGLARRVKFARPWRLEDKYPAGQSIFLDSGAFTFNKKVAGGNAVEADELSGMYRRFVSENIDRVDMVSEFDALVLGQYYIEEQRREFYDALGDKFIPVWHAEHGPDELERLCSAYSRVLITESEMASIEADSVLNNLVGRYGVKLHGASVTKVNLMRSIRWDSVGSTSWMSPAHYGDSVAGETLIWHRDKDGVGLRPVSELWATRMLDFDVRTVDERGESCWRPARTWRHEVSPAKKMYEITTVGHNSIRVTGDHSLFRLRGDVEENVRAGDIVAGDRLLYGTPELAAAGVPGMFVTIPWRHTTMRVGVELDQQFCEFLGLFWADGHHDSNGVAVSAGNDPECMKLLEEIAGRYGAAAGLRKNGVDVRLSSKMLSGVVQALGFGKLRAHQKVLPPLVFRFGKNQVAAYLRGYFSGDGCAHAHTVAVSSTSLAMLRQIRYLLECFDIFPTIGSGQLAANRKVESKHASYPLLISDSVSVREYVSHIGFLQHRKNDAVILRPPGKAGNNSRRFQPEHGLSGRYERVTKVMEVASEDFVYDLSVPGPERFWANGFIAHNTAVWTGSELKRYPMKYKDQARSRHAALFTAAGFDARKIADDDVTEVLRLSLWSWQRLMASINHEGWGPREAVVAQHPPKPEKPFGESGAPAVDHQTHVPGSGAITITRQNEIIPVMGLGGEKDDPPVLQMRSDSLRVCNTCVLKSVCPGFKEDNNCLYAIPVYVSTPAQMKALEDGVITMQSQRVMFMQMAEQLNGGYVDSNLSGEIDRLQRLIKTKRDGEKEYVKMTRGDQVEASGGPGMISRLFGSDAAKRVTEQPAQEADKILSAAILSGSVVKGGE